MAPVHPRIQELIEAEASADAQPWRPSLDEVRAGYLETSAALGGKPEPVADVSDGRVPRAGGGSVPVRVYAPVAPAAQLGMLIWLHGGGWVSGDVEGFDRVARRLANASGALCVSVGYRLAPEHPFPAAVEDAKAVVAWAGGHGGVRFGSDPRRVVVGGDSAGGQVAALAVQHARDRVRAQLLVYPALDPACSSESYRAYADGPLLTAAEMRGYWAAYLGGGSAGSASERSGQASPLGGDLAGLPQTLIAVAEHDPVRDDGLAYATALRDAGVEVETITFETMTHSFLRWSGIVEQADELIAQLGQATRIAFA